jgi:hypothetical protein
LHHYDIYYSKEKRPCTAMPRRNRQINHVKTTTGDSCHLKRQYLTERQAKETAEHQMLINSSLELSVYLCNICHKWHLTRQINTKL